jgi:hypothetical protein
MHCKFNSLLRSIARDYPTVPLLPNGKMLVIGGVGSAAVLASAELNF